MQLVLDENRAAKPRALDIGVGSGCIAISISLALGYTIYGIDSSTKALAAAAENAQRLGADVQLSACDIFRRPLPAASLDIIISNPPYVPMADKAAMPRNVIDFEPEMALFAPDDDPVAFYRQIAAQGLEALDDGGRIYVEVHEPFGVEVKRLLEAAGYSRVAVYRDMQGKDRMVRAVRP